MSRDQTDQSLLLVPSEHSPVRRKSVKTLIGGIVGRKEDC